MYKVELHREAAKEIERLHLGMKKRIIEILISLQENPYPYRKYDLKKIKGFSNVYRIRVGKYRVTYSADDKSKRIFVLEVKHRSEAYSSIGSRLEG